MTRTSLILTGIVAWLGAAAVLHAQNNIGEVFGGYSYAKINPNDPLPKQNASGWVASAGGYPNRWFGVGFEIGAQFGTLPPPSGVSAPNLSFKEYSYLAGPMFRFLDTAKVQSSAKVMLGGVFGQVNLDSATTGPQAQALGAAGYGGFNQTKFAALFAVPVDVTVTKLIGIRVEPGLYLTGFNKQTQTNFRFSIGPVFRFGAR